MRLQYLIESRTDDYLRSHGFKSKSTPDGTLYTKSEGYGVAVVCHNSGYTVGITLDTQYSPASQILVVGSRSLLILLEQILSSITKARQTHLALQNDPRVDGLESKLFLGTRNINGPTQLVYEYIIKLIEKNDNDNNTDNPLDDYKDTFGAPQRVWIPHDELDNWTIDRIIQGQLTPPEPLQESHEGDHYLLSHYGYIRTGNQLIRKTPNTTVMFDISAESAGLYVKLGNAEDRVGYFDLSALERAAAVLGQTVDDLYGIYAVMRDHPEIADVSFEIEKNEAYTNPISWIHFYYSFREASDDYNNPLDNYKDVFGYNKQLSIVVTIDRKDDGSYRLGYTPGEVLKMINITLDFDKR